MLPVLLDLKFVKIYTFGVFLVLALFWGLFLLWRNVKLTSYREEDVFDVVFTALFGALIGARLLFVAANFPRFGFNFLKFILINGYPGLSLYGTLFGGALVGYIMMHHKKIDFVRMIDYMVAPLFLSMAIAKFGSFLAGVDVGSKTKFFLAIQYLGHSGNRHITAFYESVLFLIAVYLSYRILLLIRRHVLPEGFGGVFFIFYFSASTLFLDKLKENHLYLVGFNSNVMFSGIALALSGAYFVYYFRKEISGYVGQTIKNATNAVTKKTDRSGKNAS